jgi:pimeloyl-ACP methyl ester carboxylesterase
MLCYILLLLSALIVIYLIIKSVPYTPAIKGENAIASIEKVPIGGNKQSILIRSNDTNNPILLYLHGGPGSSEMVSFRTYHPELEKHFTVVQWDQRGTGKSYNKEVKKKGMTIEMMVEDTVELIRYLLERFHQDKLFLAGHSWGTALGVLVASEYPQYLYAYIGSGQVVEPALAEKLSWEYTMTEAANNNNEKAIKELNKINSSYSYLDTKSNPVWYDDLRTERKWLVKLGGEVKEKDNYNSIYITPLLGLCEYTLIDIINYAKGSAYSLRSLWPQFMELNFYDANTDFDVPVFFLQGRYDFNTVSELVESYYQKINAPDKKLIWFEKSGHHPMYEEKELYDSILINEVLPLAYR